MKKSNILHTVITFLVIAIVSTFCVAAVMTSIKKITSILNVDVSGAELKFEIQGRTSAQSSWVFNSASTTSGVTNDEWRMTDIEFTNTSTNFAIILKIKNQDSAYKLNIEMDGVAYDYQRPVGYERFITTTGTSLSNSAVIESVGPTIKESNILLPNNTTKTIKTYSFSYNGIPSAESITITINYNLVKFNSDITDFNQDISLKLSKGEANV